MADESSANGRLVVVSNRLPINVKKDENDNWTYAPASGGLVTALKPVLQERGGLWVGWPGVVEEDAPDLEAIRTTAAGDCGYELEPVVLTGAERDGFYLGFANEIVWPLFHDLQTSANFDPSYWMTYREVNRKFAEAIGRVRRPADYLWVHDYHLMHVAKELRARGIDDPLGFFLHIPFPPLDIFLKLPWRAQVLTALLEYDLLGFHTVRDRYNFVNCVRALIKGSAVEGEGRVISLRVEDREVRLGTFPISIDARHFAETAIQPDVEELLSNLREMLPNQTVVLGVDRLDYTKGLPERFQAFRCALQQYPDLRGKIMLVQIVVPSRTEIATYSDLKTEIERLVGEINGEFTEVGWVPIQYLYRSVDFPELLAWYRRAEVALITPLKDGMNLVAKEYCAATGDDDEGVLILSEFAGAAAQLYADALLVNPYDILCVAEALHRAWAMPPEERRARRRRLRETVLQRDVFWWVDSFLKASRDSSPTAFLDEEVEHYLPRVGLREVDELG